MNGHVAVEGHGDVALDAGWQVASTPAGAVVEPSALSDAIAFEHVAVPGTAASALRAQGRWSLDGPPRRFDADDWWWRLRFTAPEHGEDAELVLAFEGLATLCEVWLDGVSVLSSRNMFRRHELPVTAGEHELVLVCRSLDAALEPRRPRPRWRAPMVEHQRLCWFRTTLLGRTPGWSPPAAPVGPWRPVRLVQRRRVAVEELGRRVRLDGEKGIVRWRGRLHALGRRGVESGVLELEREGTVHRRALRIEGEEASVELEVDDVAKWWPHTHGRPSLYELRLRLALTDGEELGVALGRVGFRQVEIDRSDRGFALRVNGAAVFCRGACWTPLDPVTSSADETSYRTALRQAADAGMNMIRVGGTMVYESDSFHDVADELGILIWQDFMFANMDYPSDAEFVDDVRAEVFEQLARWSWRPSTAVVCGNSEVEQQAAMWGAPREQWAHALFHERIPAWIDEHGVDVPYWPSSAHGGAFPHQPDEGTTSYYGVGAYLRPPDDARRSRVRFATECLAFANLPQPANLEQMPDGHLTRVHRPGFKARTPRDLGAGWDFDDVRDHYVRSSFGLDPLALRYADHERYLAVGRVVTGELMAATFAEWRTERSPCQGGLVWWLRDLWLGAGWGVVDALGVPKAPYHYLRRALAPVALSLSDEGNNGLELHVVNDRPDVLDARVRLQLFSGSTSVGDYGRDVVVPPRASVTENASAWLEGFSDLSYAYRFGPPGLDLVAATLWSGDALLARAFHLPLGMACPLRDDVGLVAEASWRQDGDVDVALTAEAFAQAVALDVPGFSPDDDYLHLAPSTPHVVRLRRLPGNDPSKPVKVRGKARPLNARRATTISISS